MTGTPWAPERGDAIWIDMSPQAGHEQAGRRPALVLSPRRYNERVGLLLCCPITRQAKGYPFEVQLPESTKVAGVVLADQVRSLDWKARSASLACDIPAEIVAEVLAKARTLLEGEAVRSGLTSDADKMA